MVAQSSSRARQRATRRMVCSFAKHRSIGFRSGLYFWRKQSVAHRRTPMHRQSVQHDDVAGAQRRCEYLFDVGEEAHAIDRTGGREAGHAQCGEQGRRVPAPVGGVVDHALAPLPTPVAANQIGSPATFIPETRAARDPRSGRFCCHAPRASATSGRACSVACTVFFQAAAELRDRPPDRREARRDLTRLAPPRLQAVDPRPTHRILLRHQLRRRAGGGVLEFPASVNPREYAAIGALLPAGVPRPSTRYT